MPKYQLLCCHVSLANDPRSIVPRGEDNPVTYPEYQILQAIHGFDAVNEAFEIGHVDRDLFEERDRLIGIYSKPVVEELFPGRNYAMPTRAEFPTKEDVDAIREAAEKAKAKRTELRKAREARAVQSLEPVEVSV